MSKLAVEFRKQLAVHAVQHQWKVCKSSVDQFVIEHQTSGGASFQLTVSPLRVWISDTEPFHAAVNCWSHVVFEAVESRIADILRDAGNDVSLAARRSASFPLNRVLRPGDPDCTMGYVLLNDLSAAEQASDFWSFYWSRAEPVFFELQSPEVFANPRYFPPFSSQTAWCTRQMLWAAIRGDFAGAHRIGFSIEKIAPSDLVSSVRALQTSAVSKGHQFQASPSALDYTAHPLWIEFLAVRDHVAKIS